MLQELLRGAGIAALVLLILYLLSRKFSLLGDGLAFLLTLIARPLVLCEWAFRKVSVYCSTACEKSLRYPPGMIPDCWYGLFVFTRLLYLLLGSCILLADMESTLAAMPVLFQVANTVTLPGGVSIASAMLFTTCGAIYGAVALECYELVPTGARLFQRFEGKTKKIIGLSCIIGFILSALILLTSWVMRAWFLTDPDNAQVLGVFILGGLGLAVGGASVLALWACIVGLVGLFSVCAWIVAALSHSLATVLSFVPGVLDILSVHLSDGRVGVYHTLLPGNPYQVAGPVFSGYRISANDPHNTLISVGSNMALPAQFQEELMKYSHKHASLVFVGPFGSQMFGPLEQALVRFQATNNILASACLDLSTPSVSKQMTGIMDVSPTHGERTAALLHEETEAKAYTTLLSELGGKLVETHLPAKAMPFPLVFVLDCYALSSAVALLQCVKRRLPLHPLVVLTSVSNREKQQPLVQEGLAALAALHADDVLETILIIDPRSPFAITHGEETQFHFVSQALVSLIIAHTHHPQNRSFTNALHELHQLSAFATFSFASEEVAIGKMPKRWAWLPATKGHAGIGDFGDTLAQARRATKRAFTEEENRSWPCDIASDTPCVVVYNTPIQLKDRRFTTFLSEMTMFLSTEHSYASYAAVLMAYPQYSTRNYAGLAARGRSFLV